MSTLTGAQIKDTYQGLLKLANSTTGITQSLQNVEDGLGNPTGLRISTNQLESENIVSFIPLKAQYYGPGFTNTAPQAYSAGIQNTIFDGLFIDSGNYAYSAITLNVVTATTSSDTFEMALYSAQMVNPLGIFPHAVIVSGITADTTTTGLKTFVFPSEVSFSGYGSGVYFAVFKISNGGVTPTVRFGGSAFGAAAVANASVILGTTQGIATNTFSGSLIRGNNAGNTLQSFSGTTNFANPFPTTIPSTQSSSTVITGNVPGFILHTKDA